MGMDHAWQNHHCDETESTMKRRPGGPGERELFGCQVWFDPTWLNRDTELTHDNV